MTEMTGNIILADLVCRRTIQISCELIRYMKISWSRRDIKDY